MEINSTSNNGDLNVVLGDTGNTLSVPMTLSAYLTGYGDRLSSKRFAEIERQVGALVLQDDNVKELHTLEWAFLRRWKHCVCRGVLMLRCSGLHTDIPFVRAREEYEVYLTNFLSRLLDPC